MRGIWSRLAILLALVQIAIGEHCEDQGDVVFPERLEIKEHIDPFYNGIYFQAEDWDGHPHFEKDDGSAHLFMFDDDCWQLDFNEQDPDDVLDEYEGGYICGYDDDYTQIGGEIYWSTSSYLIFQFGYPNELYGYCLPYKEQYEISNHVTESYNGVYFRMEDWNGHAHFGKDDRTAHLFHYDAGFGYWQLDSTEQDGTQDLYDGGYAVGADDYFQVLIGECNWSTQNSFVTFDHSFLNADGSKLDLTPDTTTEGIVFITVSNHEDEYYNGVYYQVENWGEHPHFTKEDRSAHLFYLDSGSGYWQLDDREHDGTRDYYRGGYADLGGDYINDLIGQLDWSGSSTPVKFELDCIGCVEEESGLIVYVDVTDHADDYYNGRYWQSEDWGGYVHFIKEDGTAHLYHFDSGVGYWQFDFRDQSDQEEIQDWYDGGYTSGSWDYTVELDGAVDWSGQDWSVVFAWGEGEYDVDSIGIPEEITWIEDPYIEYIIIGGHEDSYYNGVYLRAEDWNGYAHFAKGDRSAHLYYYDTGSGFWQIDYREQDGTEDYYDGGYSQAGSYMIHSGSVEWSGQDATLEMEHGYEAYECEHCAELDEGQQMYIEITNHAQDYYNGDYYMAETWNGYPHFATDDGSAHLFYLDTGGGYWQLDYRDQDGTQDYWDGGYISEGDPSVWHDTLSGEVEWSGQSEPLYMEIIYFHESDNGPGENEIAVMIVADHEDDFYNGVYYQAEDWNGNAHFATEDRRAHLFFIEWAGYGFWQLDNREQDSTGEIEDLYAGGYTYAEPHIEELEGTVEWILEDEDYNETTFYITLTYEFFDISESPECWGGNYEYYAACKMPVEDMEDMAMEGDYYYDWDTDYWSEGNNELTKSGENWSIYATTQDGETIMEANFKDFFYWATIGESVGAEECMTTCESLETMCCAGVSMIQGDSSLNQAHCMNKEVVEQNRRVTLGEMEVELTCNGDPLPMPDRTGEGAKFLTVGVSLLTLILTAMQF